ncbi:hypothetical protein [Tumebacillus flagellatus]|uniref:Uncharacterized protein n=1 Tax=Tumebacillus flagellatus TaxID=1157490 RepID=A0A074LTJ0_9BACL|nr:hypothetical protein [Tumebacillus flagellatus]KEO83890.1 hypothetical protein EL26_08220 [Tumebacillus flagellatus]
MPLRISTNSNNLSFTNQFLSQNGVAIGGNVRQSANQIAITRQGSNNTIRISGVGSGNRRRRRVDIVTITFRRTIKRGRRITSVTVIGNARQCDRFLQVGERVEPAVRCLRDAGFVLLRSRNNTLVFIRVRGNR